MAEQALTDEEVMNPAGRALSDEEVMRPAKPSSLLSPETTFASPEFAAKYAAEALKRAQAPGPGLFAAVPDYARFAAGAAGAFAAGTVDTFKNFFRTGIHAAMGEPVSLDDEISAGMVAAGATSGGFMKPGKMAGLEAIKPIVKEFDDTVIAPAAQRIDSFARTGDPNGVRLEPPLPETKPSPIKPADPSTVVGLPSSNLTSQQAQTGDPIIDSILNHPTIQAVIDNPVVDRSRTIPYEAGGSEPINRPTTYVDKHVPETFTVSRLSDPTKKVTFDTARPTIVHENVEEFAINLLRKYGMPIGPAYRVSHFDIAEVAEHAWYRANDIDPVAAEAEWKKIQPGIQHEIANDTPADLFKKEYPGADVTKARHEEIFEAKPTPEETARAFEILRNAPELKPKSAIPMLQEAKELGVTAKPLESAATDSPVVKSIKDIQPRNIAAARTGDEKITMMPDGKTVRSEYEQRFNEWVKKIDEPQAVQDLVSRVAEENQYFGEARGGQIPLAHVEQVAKAAGIDPHQINQGLLSTKFDSPGKVRAIIQVFRQTARDAIEAGEKAAAEPTEENAAKALEAEERHRYVLEYTLGLRAESGKTLAAWKDLLVEQGRIKTVYRLRGDEKAGKTREGLGDLVEAAGDFKDNIKNPPKGEELGLLKLIKAAENAVKPAEPGKPPPAPIPEELQGVVGEARKVLNRLQRGDKTPTQFYNTVRAAERELRDALKNKPPEARDPTDVLTPELKALVDKAERVTKAFGGANPEAAADFLRGRGRTAADMYEMGNAMRGMNEEQAAALMARMKGEKTGWFYNFVQQSMISGLVTHSKYAIVNTAQTELDRVIAPLLAEAGNLVRGRPTAFGAPLLAQADLIRAIPNAFRGAVAAFKSGTRMPLDSELRLYARGETSPESKGAAIPYGSQMPIEWGIWKKVFNETQLDEAGRIIGIPGKSANALHTFYKILNEQAALSARAYKAAIDEGLSPLKNNSQFWQRWNDLHTNPSDDMLKGATIDGYEGTFMERLGKGGTLFQQAAKTWPGMRWVFMFTHVPVDIAARGIKYSPLAFINKLDPVMHNALLGRSGPEAQHLALAKVAVGTAVAAFFINKAMQGQATGDYPGWLEPKERQRWKDMGIQPNSIAANGQWHSTERLGPLSIVARIASNYAHVIQNYQLSDHDEKAMLRASVGLILGTANAFLDEAGFQTAKNVVDLMEGHVEPDQLAAWQASSYLSYPSAFLAQTASITDPYMREVHGILEGLKYHVPLLRRTLLPQRDPVYGEPRPNPGYATLGRSTPINTDPGKLEMDRLKYFPVAPEHEIGKVKLTDEQYNNYEATAGQFVKRMLAAEINRPGYQHMSDEAKTERLKSIVEFGREKARNAMHHEYPELIQQGRENRRRMIQTPTEPPAVAPMPARPGVSDSPPFQPTGVLGIRG